MKSACVKKGAAVAREMEYKETIYVDPGEIDELEEILFNEKGPSRQFKTGAVIATYSVQFVNDFEADIEVCNGDPPYVSGVLYLPVEEEEEITLYEVDTLPPAGELEGEHYFSYGEDVYVVSIKKDTFNY